MATHDDFLTDPLVLAAITAHGMAVDTLPWHRTGLYQHPQVDLGVRDDAPALHIDRERVMMRWFTPEQAVTYSIAIRSGTAVRRVTVESTNLPETVMATAEGRALGEILDIPGALEMDVLSAWNEADAGVTDRSVIIDVEPYVAAFLGDTEPAILAWLRRFGYSRRGLRNPGSLKPHGGQACLTPGGSYVTYHRADRAPAFSYEIISDEGTETETVLVGGLLPDSIMATLPGRMLTDVVEIPGLGPRIVVAAEHSEINDHTILTIYHP